MVIENKHQTHSGNSPCNYYMRPNSSAEQQDTAWLMPSKRLLTAPAQRKPSSVCLRRYRHIEHAEPSRAEPVGRSVGPSIGLPGAARAATSGLSAPDVGHTGPGVRRRQPGSARSCGPGPAPAERRTAVESYGRGAVSETESVPSADSAVGFIWENMRRLVLFGKHVSAVSGHPMRKQLHWQR